MKTTKLPQAREKASDHVASDWLGERCESFTNTERSKTKPVQSRITIDILLKIALYGPSNSECTRLNEVLSYFQVSDLVTWW